MSTWPALMFKPKRGNALRANRQVSENSELFKKIDPGVQFQWERISFAVQPRRSLRIPRQNPPLVPDIALTEAEKGHWNQEGYEGPLGARGQTDPRQGSALVCKTFIKPVARQIRHTQTPVGRMLDADLSTDHRPSASPE